MWVTTASAHLIPSKLRAKAAYRVNPRYCGDRYIAQPVCLPAFGAFFTATGTVLMQFAASSYASSSDVDSHSSARTR